MICCGQQQISTIGSFGKHSLCFVYGSERDEDLLTVVLTNTDSLLSNATVTGHLQSFYDKIVMVFKENRALLRTSVRSTAAFTCCHPHISLAFALGGRPEVGVPRL